MKKPSYYIIKTHEKEIYLNGNTFSLQDKAFYVADADCVGITENIQWELNKNWLTLVACSNSPLFISSKKGVADQKQVEEIKKAYLIPFGVSKMRMSVLPILEN